MISEASNYLLSNYLDENNSVLVAAFISLFNTDSVAREINEIERELKSAEESYCGRPCCNVDDIKTAYSYIWTWRFVEATGMDFSVANQFKKLRDSVSDSHQLLFWSTLLCFWGDYDAKSPYSLFKVITEDAYLSHLASPANNQFLHDLLLT